MIKFSIKQILVLQKYIKVCTKSKYDRHPKKQELGATPIPSYAGEMLHIDIFPTDKNCF